MVVSMEIEQAPRGKRRSIPVAEDDDASVSATTEKAVIGLLANKSEVGAVHVRTVLNAINLQSTTEEMILLHTKAFISRGILSRKALQEQPQSPLHQEDRGISYSPHLRKIAKSGDLQRYYGPG